MNRIRVPAAWSAALQENSPTESRGETGEHPGFEFSLWWLLRKTYFDKLKMPAFISVKMEQLVNGA